MRKVVLVTGGARSGKSSWAEQQLWDKPGVEYVATGYLNWDDPEWVQRVQLHRQRRPKSWLVTETIDLISVLQSGQHPVLVDCLTLWLTRTMDKHGCWDLAAQANTATAHQLIFEEIEQLAKALQQCQREVYLVSNEVGMGIVPDNAGSRLFQDELGWCNSQIAAVCDEVWLCHVGIAKRWI